MSVEDIKANIRRLDTTLGETIEPEIKEQLDAGHTAVMSLFDHISVGLRLRSQVDGHLAAALSSARTTDTEAQEVSSRVHDLSLEAVSGSALEVAGTAGHLATQATVPIAHLVEADVSMHEFGSVITSLQQDLGELVRIMAEAVDVHAAMVRDREAAHQAYQDWHRQL